MTTEPFGPHQTFMRSGSVKHFHSVAGGASKTRVMTKSVPLVSAGMDIFLCSDVCSLVVLVLLRNQDPPVDAEFVGEHAEARREEHLRQRHHDLAAVGEGREHLV